MPRSLAGFAHRFGHDDRGVVSVMAVGAMLLVLAVAMIVIDTGAMFYARRDLQAATDAAALGAVRQIDNAQTAAQSILGLNGYSAGETPNVIAGVYSADPSLAPGARFDPDADPAEFNAVRVTKFSESPTYFARLFGFGDATRISATATAAYIKTVSFSAGTRVADLNDGLANQVLGGLLGTTLNLSLIDYNGLANANIEALSFLDALAAEAGLQAGSDSYADLLDTSVTLGNLVTAAVEVLNSDSYSGDRANALQALAQLPAVGASVPLNRVLNAAPYLDRTIGSIGSTAGSGTTFNLFDLLSGTAMALGEGQLVGFNTAINLGALASVTGTIQVGAPMAHMAVGKVGDFVRTSQVTVQLNVAIDTSSFPLIGASINLPIRIVAAEGRAEIIDIPCTTNVQTVLSGTVGAITAHYGDADTTAPHIATIRLGSVPVLRLEASGSYSSNQSSSTNVPFSRSDIDAGEVKSVTSDLNILAGLGSVIEINQVELTGFNLPGVNLLLSGLATTLLDLTSTISGALANPEIALEIDSLLTTLGIRLGSMDMTVQGVKCNSPTLVL